MSAGATVLRVLKLGQHEINHPHRDTAGEFGMLADYARHRGLELRWIDGQRPDQLRARLLQGEGDIVVADLGPQAQVDPELALSLSMGSYQYFVYGRRDHDVDGPLGLGGLRVGISVSSPLWPYFEQLQDSIPDLDLIVLPGNTSRDTLLTGVAHGDYDAAVAPARAGELPLDGMPRLKRLFELTAPNPVAWYFPRGSEALRDDVNSFLQRFHATLLSPRRALGDLDAMTQRRTLRVITRIDPHNYFVQDGRPAGFEHDLVQMFARERGLEVEFLVGESDQQILRWLRLGAGDLVTTRIDAGQVRVDPALTQSRSYFYSASVIIGRAGEDVGEARLLAGKRVAVVGNTVQHRALGRLVAAGSAVMPVILNSDAAPDRIAAELEQGRADAAIVDAYTAATLRDSHPLLQAGASVPSPFGYAWTLRVSDRQLDAALDEFMQRQFGSDTYRLLTDKYFGKAHEVRFAWDQLSPYDRLVQRYAESYDFDWRLIVALMYQESAFDPHAVSPAGACGLMQLTPATAKAMGVSNPFDPDAGIRGGVRYLDRLRERFDVAIPPRERTWFALAAYNAGFHHVEVARRRAAEAGLDPTRWFGHVETMMLRMGAARIGGRSHQAVEYVRAIRSLYNTYDRQQDTLTAGMERPLRPAI